MVLIYYVFVCSFEDSNGAVRTEKGFFKSSDRGGDSIHVKVGNFRYISPEGVQYETEFIADEHGYRAFGIHLDTVEEPHHEKPLTEY